MIPFALRLLFLFVAPLLLVSSISNEEIPNGDPPSAASQRGKAVVSTLALLLLQDLLSRRRGMSNHRGRAVGTKTRRRTQVRINIECAFGMLVHRWGILRKAIPMGISLAKTNALVMALCKLHNFCVDKNDLKISRPTPDDSVAIADLGGIDLHAFASSTEQGSGDEGEETTYNHETDRIDDLLDGGNHCDDFPQLRRRGVARRATGGAPLPAQVMLQYVEEQGLQRPLGGRRAR